MSTIDRIANFDIIESRRLEIQNQLDSARTKAERNRLGQFATPTALSLDILGYSKKLLTEPQEIHFLDPAFGTGVFYYALLRTFPHALIAKAWGYEIDPQHARAAMDLWGNTSLQLNIADFTRAVLPVSDSDKANLLICNPPYVRHHHLPVDEKVRLRMLARKITGVEVNGLSGLYCYFLLISHGWMADNGVAGWLIPGEFMEVNYGKRIRQYLLQSVTLLRIHSFNPDSVQFEDALVSSSIVWFKKRKPSTDHEVEFSYGGTLAKPGVSNFVPVTALRRMGKWARLPQVPIKMSHKLHAKVPSAKPKLGDIFDVKRGIATGANKFFILDREQISKYELPYEFLKPILPSPRYLVGDIVQADKDGNPSIARQLFLISCSLDENDVRARFPSLWEYLQIGVSKGIDKRYLCRHRSPWYSQENRPASPLLCTYMGRQSPGSKKPFRFILNYSRATAPNVYLMLYPKPESKVLLDSNPELLRVVWEALNGISLGKLIDEGRIYGGKLHKIEPNELAGVSADCIVAQIPELVRSCLHNAQLRFPNL